MIFWMIEISCKLVQTHAAPQNDFGPINSDSGFAFALHCLRWARTRNVGLTARAVDVLLVSLYYRVYLISIGLCNIHRNSISVVMWKRVNTYSVNLRVAAKLICNNYELTQCFYHKVNDIALFVYSTCALHNYYTICPNHYHRVTKQ